MKSNVPAGKEAITIVLSKDLCKKLLEVSSMCCTTPGEYIEDAIGSTLDDAYETGPLFAVQGFTYDRDEAMTVVQNVRKFMQRHLPHDDADPLKQFFPVPMKEETGKWQVEMSIA